MTMPSQFRGFEIAAEIARPRAGAEPPGAARWKAAEDRLYPLIMVDPALYEAVLTLVCEVVDVLRSQCDTVSELVDADVAVVLARCPSASVISALGLDPGGAFDAACACRWRELAGEDIDVELQTSQDGSR